MRVNVDSSALRDPRMRLLARHANVPDAHALGLCLHVWMTCYERRSPFLQPIEIDLITDREGFGAAMIAAGLAEDDAGMVRVRGVTERIEFLEKQIEKGKRSGEIRRRNAEMRAPVQQGLRFGSTDPGTPVQQRFRAGSTTPRTYSPAPDQSQAPDQAQDHPTAGGAPIKPSETPRVEGKAQNTPEPSAAENPRPRGPEPADEAVTLAFLLLSLIVENAPDGRVAKQTERQREETALRWARPIDLLHRKDGMAWGAIESMIRWCQRDHFWRGVILGGDNLRDKWDTMGAQRNRGSNGPPNAPPRDFNAELDDAAEAIKRKNNNGKEPPK